VNAVDLISYRARAGRNGVVISQAATTIRDQQKTDRWQRQLEPWIRIGDPRGCAYLDFGAQAAFIRWQADGLVQLDWQQAFVLVGPSDQLTGVCALEFPDLARSGLAPWGDDLPPADGTAGPRHDAVEARARSADAIRSLTPLLAHALQGARRVTMPWSEPALAEAVMWGFISILRMIGDSRPVSFLTCASEPSRAGDPPGMLVSFRPDAATPAAPDQGFAELAADLAHRFADDPARLRQTLAEHGVPTAADDGDRIRRLLTLIPGHAVLAEPALTTIMCPICLGEIPNWNTLDYWRWDSSTGNYERVNIPPDLSATQRTRFTHGAYVRCPASTDETTNVHYLPARYGSFGDPVLLGFVGLSRSGKTHLLASMVAEISKLSDYGIDVTELDHATHRDFLEKSVKPLIAGNRVLPGTPDCVNTTLADAFIIRQGNGPERVVALFDVSGGDLIRPESTKEFLWIADGLFFVVDPDRIEVNRAGDDSFDIVLDIMSARPKPEPFRAAIVLSKADLVRFEEPVDHWLLQDASTPSAGALDPLEFLQESADVYAYLEQHQALALAEPYVACDKATLHFASPAGGACTDGGIFPRGVTPRQVLRPLLAMLAMTGALTGPGAEVIGI
jgi:hypothetical protein